MTLKLPLRMFARCPSEPIHPANTSAAVGYPDAMFSPQVENPGVGLEWLSEPCAAIRSAQLWAAELRVPSAESGERPFSARTMLTHVSTSSTHTGAGGGGGAASAVGVGVGVTEGVGDGVGVRLGDDEAVGRASPVVGASRKKDATTPVRHTTTTAAMRSIFVIRVTVSV